MSLEAAWKLPRPIESWSTADVLGWLRDALPSGAAVEITGEPVDRVIAIEFAAAQVDVVASKLALSELLGTDWRRDLDPPRDGDTYELMIDMVDDDGPLLRIYSNDSDEGRRGCALRRAIV